MPATPKNLAQVYVANPVTTIGNTDLLYMAIAGTTDGAIAGSSVLGMFAGKDANGNVTGNSFLAGYATTATSGITTTLTVASKQQQYFTGSTTQTVVLPVTSTLVLGQSFLIVNNSSGVVTVQSSGTNTITAMAANTKLWVTCILTSGTTAASWNAEYSLQTPTTLPISLANGGTNASLTANNGGIFYSTSTAGAILAGTATAGQLLVSGSTAAPAWTTSTYPSTNAINTLLYASSANVMSALATNNSSVLVTSSGGVPSLSTTLPAGLTIPGYGGVTWNDISGTSQAAAINNGYIISNASQTTVTLPATSAEGTVFSIAGKGAAGWVLQANTGQVIHLGSAASSSAGTLTSTNQYDSVSIVCVTANTTFVAYSVIGNITVA